MRTVSKPKGYLTVYLSLVFAIVLSLLLTLIEGAAVGATRLQAELAADLGIGFCVCRISQGVNEAVWCILHR